MLRTIIIITALLLSPLSVAQAQPNKDSTHTVYVRGYCVNTVKRHYCVKPYYRASKGSTTSTVKSGKTSTSSMSKKEIKAEIKRLKALLK